MKAGANLQTFYQRNGLSVKRPVADVYEAMKKHGIPATQKKRARVRRLLPQLEACKDDAARRILLRGINLPRKKLGSVA